MNTDVNYIMRAYKGRVSMLDAIFGSSEKNKPPPTPQQILTFARTHNALYSHGRLKGIRPKKAKE